MKSVRHMYKLPLSQSQTNGTSLGPAAQRSSSPHTDRTPTRVPNSRQVRVGAPPRPRAGSSLRMFVRCAAAIKAWNTIAATSHVKILLVSP